MSNVDLHNLMAVFLKWQLQASDLNLKAGILNQKLTLKE